MTVKTTGFSSYNVLFTDGPYATTQNYTSNEKQLNRVLRRGQGGRRLRAVLYALTGNTVGGAKSLTAKRIQGVQQLNSDIAIGGLVPIETVTLVSGVTTSADLAKMQDDMTHNNKPIPYPQAKGNRLGYTQMVNSIV